MYLAYNAPHAPDQATKHYLEQTKHIEYAGRSIYAAMVNAVDAGVGKIDSVLIRITSYNVCYTKLLRFYELVDGQLVFYHDLLKSSFYLLSAYQELHNKQPDPMGRFQFQHSIQSELGFVTTPLVNYYFEVLVDVV